MSNESFSDRFGYHGQEITITVREDAPQSLRDAIVLLGYEVGLDPHQMRSVLCEVLLRRPDPNNWSAYPNVAWEVESLIDEAPWYKVYDIVEKVYRLFQKRSPSGEDAQAFERRLNSFFRENGIGWEMQEGRVIARGSEAFGSASNEAIREMGATGRSTASREMHEALQDISRRPHADVTGAIQHAMAALECVARDIAGSKETLGRIIPTLSLPKPLDSALQKLWGFASEQGRHIQEGREPRFEEAELIVTIASSVSTYLIRAAKSDE